MIQAKQIAWLAGLLEGEGSFNRYDNRIKIQFGTTDRDVAESVAEMMDCNLRGPYKHAGRKDSYQVGATGRRAAEWMMTVYSLMGSRRRKAIREALSHWLTVRTRSTPPKCHPGRQYFALWMCRPCYRRKKHLDGRVGVL